MDFGLLIIGDEIIHGNREDAHFKAIKSMLQQRGLRLKWVKYIGDEREEIATCLAQSFHNKEVVFVTGGIGATPDDHTRQAAAMALRLELVPHPEAVELIHQITLDRDEIPEGAIYEQRLQMAAFPKGAQIIPNPFNRVAGFSIQSHYFVPGFPVMAHPMLEWVLDTHYQDWFFKEKHEQRAAIVLGLQESAITPSMIETEHIFKGVSTYSLPTFEVDDQGKPLYKIELGVKAYGGSIDLLDQAWNQLCIKVQEIGGKIQPLDS